MSHDGVENPVVLGDRLHVGGEPTFEPLYLSAEYLLRVSVGGVFTPFGLPPLQEFREVDDAREVTLPLLRANPLRAIGRVRIRAGASGVFVLLGWGGGASIVAEGRVVEIELGQHASPDQ
jgi:hypothetical protein